MKNNIQTTKSTNNNRGTNIRGGTTVTYTSRPLPKPAPQNPGSK